MALVLSLREGEDFFAGHQRIVMGGRGQALSFIVKVDDRAFDISTQSWTEVHPGVQCRASIHQGSRAALHRIEINAPSMPVLKGSNYRTTRKETP